MSGIGDKLGNVYELEFVRVLWLRLLLGHIEEVAWEPVGRESEGTEGYFVEGGTKWYFQCKSRQRATLTAKVVTETLTPMWQHLQGAPGHATLLLVSDARCEALELLLQWAKVGPPDGPPPHKASDLMDRLLRTAHAEGTPDVSRSMLTSVELATYRTRELLDLQRAYALSFGAGVSEDLMSAVRLLHVPQVLARRMTGAMLRELLPKHLRGVSAEASDGLRDRLLQWRTSFVASARARRHSALASIERPEAHDLYTGIQAAPDAVLFLVHGPTGSGKSDTLARFVEAWSDDTALLVVLDGGDVLPTADQLRLALVRSVSGERRPVLLIDQLDELALVPERLKPVERALEEASRLGFTVVLGCRTVDARDGTYLQHLFARWGGRCEQVEIGELPETSVTEALSKAGLTWQRVPRPLHRIVRMPLGLRIVLELVGRHGSLDATSFYELIDSWLASALRDPIEHADALHLVLENFERDGVVVEQSLECKGTAIDALVAAGILYRSGRSTIRFAHQVIADTLLARKLGRCTNIDEVLARIGRLADQGPREATRLRRAAVLIAGRGLNGARLLDELYRCDSIRPLVRHALLLGLADSSEAPTPALARVIEGWLRDEGASRAVSSTLLWSRGAWVEPCVGWIEAQWAAGGDESRHHLLHLLASVSDQRGEMVANLLGAWRADDPDVLDRAEMIFWQDPSKDSDTLFELRLDAPRRPRRHRPLSWSDLAEAHPDRAARLITAVLQQVDPASLVSPPDDDALDLPSAVTLGEALPAMAEALVNRLHAWWNGLPPLDTSVIESGARDEKPSTIAVAVELLARAHAHLLRTGQVTWSTLVQSLPEQRRGLDQWLLLEVGAHSTDAPSHVADEVVEWLIAEEDLVLLRLGRAWWRRRYEHVARFIAALGGCVSEMLFEALEDWVLERRDPWSPELEQRRVRASAATGDLSPNEHGLIAYRLLARLPEGRLSPRARARLVEVRRKFDPVRETLLGDGPPLPRGFVGSRIDHAVVQSWTIDEWMRQLRTVRDRELGEQRGEFVVVHDLGSLTQQLAYACGRNPSAYLALVHRILDDGHRIRGFELARVVASLCTLRAPAGIDAATWQALSDEQTLSVVLHERIVAEPSFEVDLGRIVQNRPLAGWPTKLVDQLVASARAEDALDGPSAEDVESLLLNHGPCVSLGGLIALAESRTRLHESLLELAEELIAQGPSSRRAVAAGLAYTCRKHDLARASAAVLKACDDAAVAGSYRIQMVLLGLHREAVDAGGRELLVRALLNGVNAVDGDTRRRSGEVAVAMHEQAIIERERLEALLRRDGAVRMGAARYVGGGLRAGREPGLFLPMALELADDEDDRVSGEIVRAVTSKPARRLLTDRAFIEQLLGTRAGRRHVDDLLEALDEVGHLAPVTDRLLEVVQQVALAATANADGRQQWRRERVTGTLCARLARVADEVQSRGDVALRTRVLDALDLLIKVDASAARSTIDLATLPDDSGVRR